MHKKIFDLVSFSKLGFSDINMSAAYAKKKKGKEREDARFCKAVTTSPVKTCNILKPLGGLRKPL